MDKKAKDSPAGVGGAMIFSAGLGTRFKPWTDKHPKALAVVNGKTLLQRNIEYLQQYGIRDIIVNVHHFPEEVIETVKKYNGWGSKLLISDEKDQLLETGGGLLKARNLFTPGERFVTCNVDILTDLDINKLLAYHDEKKALISFGVTDRVSSRYLLFDEEDRLCGWRNKTTGEEKIVILKNNLSEKAYSCVVVFEYAVFDLFPFTGKFSLIDVYLHLAAQHRIMGYDHSGDRLVDVGKPESVAVAASLFP
ncbi:MAG: sugar phosphate nucleotidyltransferase [Chitinophagaceae bacterium]